MYIIGIDPGISGAICFFKDGKIIGGGDYFDFGGFMASFQE